MYQNVKIVVDHAILTFYMDSCNLDLSGNQQMEKTMKTAENIDLNPQNYITMNPNRFVYSTMLDLLMSPEDSKAFKDKMNAKIMAEPDFEEDHLMKDSDLHETARNAFNFLDEQYREPYADWIASLPN